MIKRHDRLVERIRRRSTPVLDWKEKFLDRRSLAQFYLRVRYIYGMSNNSGATGKGYIDRVKKQIEKSYTI